MVDMCLGVYVRHVCRDVCVDMCVDMCVEMLRCREGWLRHEAAAHSLASALRRCRPAQQTDPCSFRKGQRHQKQ